MLNAWSIIIITCVYPNASNCDLKLLFRCVMVTAAYLWTSRIG